MLVVLLLTVALIPTEWNKEAHLKTRTTFLEQCPLETSSYRLAKREQHQKS